MSLSPFWRAIVACRAKRSACASAIGCAGEGFGAARSPESVLSRRRSICGRSANSFASALRTAGARLGSVAWLKSLSLMICKPSSLRSSRACANWVSRWRPTSPAASRIASRSRMSMRLIRGTLPAKLPSRAQRLTKLRSSGSPAVNVSPSRSRTGMSGAVKTSFSFEKRRSEISMRPLRTVTCRVLS